MMRHFIILIFLVQTTVIVSGHHYLPNLVGFTWEDGKQFCESQGLVLAEIKSPQDLADISVYLNSYDNDYNGAAFWIGAVWWPGANNYTWNCSGEPLQYATAGFNPAEPDGTPPFCLALSTDGPFRYFIDTFACSDTHSIICDTCGTGLCPKGWKKVNSLCTRKIKEEVKFKEGYHKCLHDFPGYYDMGEHLLRPEDIPGLYNEYKSKDEIFLVNSVLNVGGYWSGYHNSSVTDFSQTGEPDDEDCEEGSVLAWKPYKKTHQNPHGKLFCQSKEEEHHALCIAQANAPEEWHLY